MSEPSAPRQDIQSIVRGMLEVVADRMSNPPEPVMSQEEFDKLPVHRQAVYICNIIGCGNVVSTHGLLCVKCLANSGK